VAQDERRGFEIVEDFPFMLRLSKHSEPFFSTLLDEAERDPGYDFFSLIARQRFCNGARVF
jgi:hypothetical protein